MRTKIIKKDASHLQLTANNFVFKTSCVDLPLKTKIFFPFIILKLWCYSRRLWK